MINSDIENLNTRMQDYLAINQNVSERNRHILLTFNILNFAKNSLYTISQFIHTTDDEARLALFDDYFRSRLTAIDTKEILDRLLATF